MADCMSIWTHFQRGFGWGLGRHTANAIAGLFRSILR
jgi:hypothetical protein